MEEIHPCQGVRLLTVLQGEVPDCAPVAPDLSNMMPARRTGKPFGQFAVELYLVQRTPERLVVKDSYVDGGPPNQEPATRAKAHGRLPINPSHRGVTPSARTPYSCPPTLS